MNTLALQERFIGEKDFRNQYIEKTEVLSKVKTLTLLPNNEHMTIKMVADFYEVDEVTIRQIRVRHKDELEYDGLKTVKGEELKQLKKGLLHDVTNLFASSVVLVPRRAVLRFGMLLRDSEIAKQVRTYLLNAEEITTREQRSIASKFTGTWEHEEEIILMNCILAALNNGGTIGEGAKYASQKINHSKGACANRFHTNLKKYISDEKILAVIENNKRTKGKVISLAERPKSERSENSVELSKQIDKVLNNQLQQIDDMKRKIDLLNDEKKQLIEQVNELTLKNKEIEYDVNLKNFMLVDKDQQIALIQESHVKEINSIKAESERIITHLKTYKRKYRALEEVFNSQMRIERNKKTEEQKQKKGTSFTIQNGVPVFE
ncbi:hypothetical protein [Paenibacillus oleatilyticus]|uniref:hypothetical protein n=1 Tax=Paenibacillus oleatilyticus TaxID=2594886 RepID=UPI001C1FA83A|nr:hypothetical protein [Paenibacillus oleatilyticus]MBU7316097.1 hypothetical protein [Paenibacillus oleatilyticus]